MRVCGLHAVGNGGGRRLRGAGVSDGSLHVSVLGGDTLAIAALAITTSVNAFSALLQATVTGIDDSGVLHGRGIDRGEHGGRERESVRGVFVFDRRGHVGCGGEDFANGTSPTPWRVTLDFAALQGTTYSGSVRNALHDSHQSHSQDALDLCGGLAGGQFRAQRIQRGGGELDSDGTNRTYSVAGPGSRRVEDHDASMVFSGSWTEVRGNYSGGTIHTTTTPGDSLSCSYQATQSHSLYVGLRYTGTGGVVSISVDGAAALSVNPGIRAKMRCSATRWEVSAWGRTRRF